MTHSRDDNSDGGALGRLLGLHDAESDMWQADELGALLRHQLSSAIQSDLLMVGVGDVGAVHSLLSRRTPRISSFSELFMHPSPPVELLERAKDFAKAVRRVRSHPLPREVATVLYFASIAAAMVRCGRRITRLDNHALREGYRWVMAQSWVYDPLRALTGRALADLEDSEWRDSSDGGGSRGR